MRFTRSAAVIAGSAAALIFGGAGLASAAPDTEAAAGKDLSVRITGPAMDGPDMTKCSVDVTNNGSSPVSGAHVSAHTFGASGDWAVPTLQSGDSEQFKLEGCSWATPAVAFLTPLDSNPLNNFDTTFSG